MTEMKITNRKLVLLEYPAIVQSAEKMLKTLGGIDEISKAYSDPSRRLELRYRPDDPYCKSAYANRFHGSCLLLKVKKNRNSGIEPSYTVSIEGTVTTAYKFRGMMDFQYLPMERHKDGTGYKSLLDLLIPPTLSPISWLQGESPVFILPQVFSRLDTPAVQPLRDEPRRRVLPGKPSGRPENVLGGTRHRRVKFACFLNFEDPEVPMEPNPEAWKQLEWRPADPLVQKRVIELFDERPLWTRSALQVAIGVHPSRFKLVLPVVAYYVLSGPFRASWVRLGFDPRKDPSTKPYQILDFRLSASPGGVRDTVAPKRGLSAYLVPTRVVGITQRPITAQTDCLAPPPAEKRTTPDNWELVCTYKPGQLPPFRQLFYHLRDVQMEKVQQLIHANDGR